MLFEYSILFKTELILTFTISSVSITEVDPMFSNV